MGELSGHVAPNRLRNEFKITLGEHSFIGRITFEVIAKIEQTESLFDLTLSITQGKVKMTTVILVLYSAMVAYDPQVETSYDEFCEICVKAGAGASLIAMKDFTIMALRGVPKQGKAQGSPTKLKGLPQ